MKPCVVVSREMGSEGDTVALDACELTGYRFIHTHTIGKLARRNGLQGSEWRWLDQGWYRLFARLEERPDVHLGLLRQVLLETCADRRGALFLGRGIGELLAPHVPILRVHVVAPFDLRCERIMRQVNIPRSRAEERVQRSDEENAWFYGHFFELDWKDWTRYDLVIDTDSISVREGAVRIAAAVAGLADTASTRGGRTGGG